MSIDFFRFQMEDTWTKNSQEYMESGKYRGRYIVNKR